MGPKCSCLYNREGNSTYKFDEDIDQNKLKNDLVHVNPEYSKALNKKSILDKTNDSSISERIAVNFDDATINSMLMKLQSIVRSFFSRKKYKKNKKNMIEEANRLILKFETTFLVGNIAKTDNSYSTFEPTGWTRMYTDHNDIKKFNFNYGKIFTVKILIYRNPEAYYSGSININYQRHGVGTYITKDGKKFEGYWVQDEFTGWGRLIDQEGSMLQGNEIFILSILGYFHKGLLNGKGEKKTLTKTFYAGNFINNSREGIGTEDTPEHIYQGEFKNDKKEGNGQLTYKNTKDFYEGEFKDNFVHGFGFYIWANKDTYKGEFINGKMHGRGTYKWPDGGEYVGEYIANVKQGKGKFRWPNGRVYEGPFVEGKPNGVGNLTIESKTVEVEFVDGKINKNYKKNKSSNNIMKNSKEHTTQSSPRPIK